LFNDGVGVVYEYGSVFGFITYNTIGWNEEGNAYESGGYGQWDDGISIGNTWSDYESPPTYPIPGPAESVDDYPRVIKDVVEPTIVTSKFPENPNSTVPVIIEAKITDVSQVGKAILSYKINDDEWVNTTMEKSGTKRIWFALIPPTENGTLVRWRVYARDIYNNWALSPTHTYTVTNPTDNSTTTSTTTNGSEPDAFSIGLGILVTIPAAAVVLIFVVYRGSWRKR